MGMVIADSTEGSVKVEVAVPSSSVTKRWLWLPSQSLLRCLMFRLLGPGAGVKVGFGLIIVSYFVRLVASTKIVALGVDVYKRQPCKFATGNMM